MKQVIVIPARMSGKRLPNKPLIKILGKEMLLHVWELCQKVFDRKKIYVATEDIKIVNFCHKFGIQVVKTSYAPTALYRIKLFSDKIKAKGYININGDEPVANLKDIRKLIKYNKKYPNRVVIGSGFCSKQKYNDSTKAKIITSNSGKLLYCSRLSLPYSKKDYTKHAKSAVWHHALNKNALDKYVKNFNLTKLDKLEGIEINGMLEAEINVHTINMVGDNWAVDVKKDIKIVENILKKNKRKA